MSPILWILSFWIPVEALEWRIMSDYIGMTLNVIINFITWLGLNGSHRKRFDLEIIEGGLVDVISRWADTMATGPMNVCYTVGMRRSICKSMCGICVGLSPYARCRRVFCCPGSLDDCSTSCCRFNRPEHEGLTGWFMLIMRCDGSYTHTLSKSWTQ